MPDYQFVSYTIDTSKFDSPPELITGSITPNGVKTFQILRFDFQWIDGVGESSNDIGDTKYSHDFDKTKWNISISFTQSRS